MSTSPVGPPRTPGRAPTIRDRAAHGLRALADALGGASSGAAEQSATTAIQAAVVPAPAPVAPPPPVFRSMSAAAGAIRNALELQPHVETFPLARRLGLLFELIDHLQAVMPPTVGGKFQLTHDGSHLKTAYPLVVSMTTPDKTRFEGWVEGSNDRGEAIYKAQALQAIRELWPDVARASARVITSHLAGPGAPLESINVPERSRPGAATQPTK
ncbi:MAG: hypothetical protein ACKVPX_14335 [Myxococcaceae bacterium]